MLNKNFYPLLEVGVSLTKGYTKFLSSDIIESLYSILYNFLEKKIQHEEINQFFIQKIGNTLALDKICKVLELSELTFCNKEKQFFSKPEIGNNSKLNWTNAEDLRLLAGIHKFGLNNWNEVSKFVGFPRTRADCSQRWFRNLDPRISTIIWDSEEDKKLIFFVQNFGENWSQISSLIGNRTESQCRFRYKQIRTIYSKKDFISDDSSFGISFIESSPTFVNFNEFINFPKLFVNVSCL